MECDWSRAVRSLMPQTLLAPAVQARAKSAHAFISSFGTPSPRWYATPRLWHALATFPSQASSKSTAALRTPPFGAWSVALILVITTLKSISTVPREGLWPGLVQSLVFAFLLVALLKLILWPIGLLTARPAVVKWLKRVPVVVVMLAWPCAFFAIYQLDPDHGVARRCSSVTCNDRPLASTRSPVPVPTSCSVAASPWAGAGPIRMDTGAVSIALGTLAGFPWLPTPIEKRKSASQSSAKETVPSLTWSNPARHSARRFGAHFALEARSWAGKQSELATPGVARNPMRAPTRVRGRSEGSSSMRCTSRIGRRYIHRQRTHRTR
jgi:hypothetical protein